MKTIARIAEGLRILSGYDLLGDSVTLEHDQLWAGPDDATDVSVADCKQLLELGWVIDDDIERWTFTV